MTSEVKISFGQPVMKFDDGEPGARLYRKDLPAGAAAWVENHEGKIAALDITCPCGCATVHCLSVTLGEKIERHWLWNGNKEKPTLSPSIHCVGTPCKWHGFLTDGVFKSC